MDRVHLVKEFANIVVVVVVDFALWVDSILQVEVVEMSRRRLEMVEEVVEMSRYMVEEMVAACVREGAFGASMSGSGSAVFGLFTESAARRAVGRLQRPDWLVLLTRTLTRREAARRMGL